MNKIVLSVVVSFLLVASMFIGVSHVDFAGANFVPTPVEIVYIQPDGSVKPSTAPIARMGDTYTLTANISDSLIEVQRDGVVLDGAGFTLERKGEFTYAKEGVLLQGRTRVTIANFTFIDFSYGVRLSNSSGCAISGNTFSAVRYGIWISDHSTNNLISRNVISQSWAFGHGHSAKYMNNYYGISIHNSSHNTLRDNQMIDNYRDFWVDASGFASPLDLTNDVDSSNTVNGKPIYYWVGEHDRTVPTDAGYVALINCRNITAENLNLGCNGQGVLLAYTSDSTVKSCNLYNNTFGIEIQQSPNNRILDNQLGFNDWGISTYTSGNMFAGNRLSDNANNANFECSYIEWLDGSNTIEGAPAYCWVEEHDKTVPSDAGWVALVNCSGITVQDLFVAGQKQSNQLVVPDQKHGILFLSTSNSTIANCTIIDGVVGICLKDSSEIQIIGNRVANNSENGVSIYDSRHCTLSGNMLSENRRYGVYAKTSNNIVLAKNRVLRSQAGVFLNQSSRFTIQQNEFKNNTWVAINLEFCNDNEVVENYMVENGEYSLILKASTNNIIYLNNFVNNGWRSFNGAFEIYSPWPCEPNSWDNGTAGNYWSNYQTRYPNASETGTSGIGDTAYFINVNNIDRYPLTRSVSIVLPPEPSIPVSHPLPAPNFSPFPSQSPSSNPTTPSTSTFPSAPQLVGFSTELIIVTVVATAIIVSLAAVFMFASKRKKK